jgi:WD40 repeat protein
MYDPSSGKMASQVVARTNEENVGCPSFPLYFRASEQSQVIVDDGVQSAVSEWDVATGKLIRYLKDETTGPGPAPYTDSLSLSFDGRLVAVVRSRTEGIPDYSITVWDLSDGKPVYHTLARSVSDPIRGIYFSPYGKIVAFVYRDHVEVYQYDVR